jgi:hypothetical protein
MAEELCEATVNKGKDKSTDDFLFDLVTNDLNLARTFATVAHSAYRSMRLEEGESARSKAMKFYCAALQSVLQMDERDRNIFLSDIDNLRSRIEWLSLQREGSAGSSQELDEGPLMEQLLRLLDEQRPAASGQSTVEIPGNE